MFQIIFHQKMKQKKQKKLVDMEGLVTHNLSNGKFNLVAVIKGDNRLSSSKI